MKNPTLCFIVASILDYFNDIHCRTRKCSQMFFILEIWLARRIGICTLVVRVLDVPWKALTLTLRMMDRRCFWARVLAISCGENTWASNEQRAPHTETEITPARPGARAGQDRDGRWPMADGQSLSSLRMQDWNLHMLYICEYLLIPTV